MVASFFFHRFPCGREGLCLPAMGLRAAKPFVKAKKKDVRCACLSKKRADVLLSNRKGEKILDDLRRMLLAEEAIGQRIVPGAGEYPHGGIQVMPAERNLKKITVDLAHAEQIHVIARRFDHPHIHRARFCSEIIQSS